MAYWVVGANLSQKVVVRLNYVIRGTVNYLERVSQLVRDSLTIWTSG